VVVLVEVGIVSSSEYEHEIRQSTGEHDERLASTTTNPTPVCVTRALLFVDRLLPVASDRHPQAVRAPLSGAKEESMQSKYPFPHHKLDAWNVAVELATKGRRLAESIPTGDRDLAAQLRRSSTAAVLLIGEGAGRRTAGNKRARFSEARGECSETAAAAELAAVLGLVPHDEAREVVHLAGRVAAMLTRLIQRFS